MEEEIKRERRERESSHAYVCVCTHAREDQRSSSGDAPQELYTLFVDDRTSHWAGAPSRLSLLGMEPPVLALPLPSWDRKHELPCWPPLA